MFPYKLITFIVGLQNVEILQLSRTERARYILTSTKNASVNFDASYWYRGLNRGPIGTIVSNLIRSHHILMAIVIIGLTVE